VKKQEVNSGTCRHSDPRHLRLITYTSYGPMVGCLRCGSAKLIRQRR
jgi:hypothetical protein